MFTFTCPVCSQPLVSDGVSCRCENKHCFDIARGGWINLLISKQSGSKRHGDDALMIRARTAFLDRGWYTPLLDGIWSLLEPHVRQNMRILDAGCGDGWYLNGLTGRMTESGIASEALGIDISRDAVKAAARRCAEASFAVAGVTALPVANSSCDLILSLFAPVCLPEFGRALHRDGLMIRAYPLERHLYELKEAVYDRPIENPPECFSPEGFRLIDSTEVRFRMPLDTSDDIKALFAMTPYYYKTSAADQAKLDNVSQLTVTAEFGICLYGKE